MTIKKVTKKRALTCKCHSSCWSVIVNPVRELRLLTVCAEGGIIPPSDLIR